MSSVVSEEMASDAEVLAWANEQRAVLDLTPLDRIQPGRSNASECPIAKTLGFGYQYDVVAYEEFFYIDPTLPDDEYALRGVVSQNVYHWIKAFDNGEKPEYRL